MRRVDIADPVGQNVAQVDATAGDRFTPAAFVREAGTVIAVCLGLGLLTQLLLG